VPDISGSALWETRDGGAALAAPSIARAGAIDAVSWSSPARARASWSIAPWSSTSRSSAWWSTSATWSGLASLGNAAHDGYGES
jgi:hypothetical protein